MWRWAELRDNIANWHTCLETLPLNKYRLVNKKCKKGKPVELSTVLE